MRLIDPSLLVLIGEQQCLNCLFIRFLFTLEDVEIALNGDKAWTLKFKADLFQHLFVNLNPIGYL